MASSTRVNMESRRWCERAVTLFSASQADAVQGLDHQGRVMADGGLGGEHHGVGAVEHGVGHIEDLGARRDRVLDHRLHHLGGGDDDAVELPGPADDALLQRRHGGVADLHPEVAARDHDGVGGIDDGIEMFDGLGALDLGDNAALAPGLTQALPRQVHVLGAAQEGDGDVIGADGGGEADVVLVLVGQRRGRETAALLVDALVVGEFAAVHHVAMDVRADHRLDQQLDGPVVEQQGVARGDVLDQFRVCGTDAPLIAAVLGAIGIEDEGVAVGELDGPSRNLPMRIFGPCRSTMNRRLRGRRPRRGGAPARSGPGGAPGCRARN